VFEGKQITIKKSKVTLDPPWIRAAAGRLHGSSLLS
jgi:hypothetical protein